MKALLHPSLKQDYRVALADGRAYIARRSDGARVAALNAAEAILVSLMTGRHSLKEIERRFVEIAGVEPALHLFALTGRLKALLEDGGCYDAEHSIAALASVSAPDPSEGFRVLPGPKVLHWWVTSVCPRRCAYCFADPVLGGRPVDSILSREELRAIFAEASDLGAERMLVAGAEPFLRRDLPEVIGDAISLGLQTVVTTKHPISASLAERIAASGLPQLSISIDTFDEIENERLIGARAYGAQVRDTCKNLARAGVPFSFQAVANGVTPSALEAVADEAAALGAIALQIVPFEPVINPITAYGNGDLTFPHVDDLDNLVEHLSQKHKTLHVEKFVEAGEDRTEGFHCDIGMTKMFFLPNGVVHRCYKLRDDRSLDGRSLRRHSVAEAWHDPDFYDLTAPDRALYADAECNSCGGFDACGKDGRCIYRAKADHGAYWRQDRACGGPYVAADTSTSKRAAVSAS